VIVCYNPKLICGLNCGYIMVRPINRLNALAVSRANKPGLYPDGGGLYLQVSPSGKSWVYRFMLNGVSRYMGLGPLATVSLKDARRARDDAARLRNARIDPIEARRQERSAVFLDAAKATTFRDAAVRYIESHEKGWRNKKHAGQWRATLETYVYPMFGSVAVGDVDTDLVMKVLEPIWYEKTETAARVRGRIEAILDAAKAREQRAGENPARWRGHLENLLRARSKVRQVSHHPALPYDEIAAFMADLRKQEGISARALEFLVLTAARTSETIGATEREIDLDEKVWTIPPERIKAEREHRVPLSAPALAIISEMRKLPGAGFVFPGQKKGKPLSNMALLALLKRMGRADLTAHGFRSSFRDWAAECTGYPNEVAEMALAHVVKDKTEAAYRRGDLFAKRRRLMDDWARYCASATAIGEVVPMRADAG
jgi:integrase